MQHSITKLTDSSMQTDSTQVQTFFAPAEVPVPLFLTLYTERVPAGFPSPAEDYSDSKLDLNDYLIANAPATFLTRVCGSSMIGAGIHDGDLLVVDRSISPTHGDIVIAVVNGEHLVKRLSITNDEVALISENPEFPKKVVLSEEELHIWGVVRHCIHSFKRK